MLGGIFVESWLRSYTGAVTRVELSFRGVCVNEANNNG